MSLDGYGIGQDLMELINIRDETIIFRGKMEFPILLASSILDHDDDIPLVVRGIPYACHFICHAHTLVIEDGNFELEHCRQLEDYRHWNTRTGMDPIELAIAWRPSKYM